jgi:hypothetical protein
MKLAARPHLVERRGRGGQLRRREPKGKMYSCEDATDAQARWADRGGFGLRGQQGQRAGWPKAEWAARSARPKVRKKDF